MARESEALGTSSLARTADRTAKHFSGADSEDRIEMLGKRIGRGLGLIAVLLLAWHVLTTYILS